MSSNVLFCTHYIGNVIYQKFSHDDVSYRTNGENINVMLEFQYTEYERIMCEHLPEARPLGMILDIWLRLNVP